MLRRSWVRVLVVGGVCAAVVVGGVCALVVLPASAASGSSSAKSKTFSQVLEVTGIPAGGNCVSPSFDLPDKVSLRLASIIVRFNGVDPSDLPRASLILQARFDESTARSFHLPIPLDVPTGLGSAAGRLELGDIVVTELPFVDVPLGQPFAVSICLNRGSAAAGPTAFVLLTAGKA
jgi:hypothetical protein